MGELSPGDSPPKWRVHDRTHLEFAVDYPLGDKLSDWVWEAYFFIPTSLRIHSGTYGKGRIYEDLHSYVRFAVPGLPLEELTRHARQELCEKLRGPEAEAVRELRLYASCVRTSMNSARRHLQNLMERGDDSVDAAAMALAAQTRELLRAMREAFAECATDLARMAADYVDEDLSILAETTLASLSLDLRRAKLTETASRVAAGAVHEARYRRERGLDGVGSARVGKREVEHLEFRRHLLKRFTGSVLHLDTDVARAGRLTLEILYALAASVAMAFAVVMALYHGPTWRRFGDMWLWATVVVLAYAGKDRIKATLQGVFSRWASRHLPDRRWRVSDPQSKRPVGTVRERSAFLPLDKLPADVLEVRNSTRGHSLERHARPEAVLWHQKACRWDRPAIRRSDARFVAVTEVFRLDLTRWLAHTDDPKQRIVFADPEDQHIYSAVAPRVYNIAVVYRLRRASEPDTPWKRVRVVVSRKGIRRVEQVVP